MLVSILVFLLLGGGAWYILGQRGMVQSPRATFTQLKASLQAGPSTDATQNSTSVVPEFSPSEEAASDTAAPATAATSAPDSTPAASASASEPDAAATGSADTEAPSPESSSGETTSDATTSDAPASQESASDDTPPDPAAASEASSSSDTATAASASTIAPEEGGWSIIVASRTDREAARSLAETYRDRFQAQSIPTGILEASVDNSTRYRVGVGQFSSQSDVQRFLDENSGDLPDGAWAIRL